MKLAALLSFILVGCSSPAPAETGTCAAAGCPSGHLCYHVPACDGDLSNYAVSYGEDDGGYRFCADGGPDPFLVCH